MPSVGPMGALVLALIASYLLGSIPSAHIAGSMHGVDLRKHGSGNLGATNVIRVLGMRVGLVVFAVDAAKGAIPVLVIARLVPAAAAPFGSPIATAILCGMAAVIGHVRPVFLGFGRGGKGVATAAGAFAALAPLQTLLVLLVFAVVVLTSGYVSLGSLTSAAILPILLGVTVGPRSPLFGISVLLTVFVFWTHRANIARLRNGDEHRFGKPGLPAKRPAATVAIGITILVAIAIAARFA